MFYKLKLRLRTWFDHTPRHAAAPAPVRLRLEPLELRDVPATLTVSTTDGGGVTPNNDLSLNEAVQYLNETLLPNGSNVQGKPELTKAEQKLVAGDLGTNDKIVFNVAGAGVKRISFTDTLPEVSKPAVIDGTTQPGYAGTPLIELDGSNPNASPNGLELSGGWSTVRGLSIINFAFDGVRLVGAKGGSAVEACYIGIDANGAMAPNKIGVEIGSSPGNRVGAAGPAPSNVISGNKSVGVFISGGASQNNRVLRNYVGTDKMGKEAVPNEEGVRVSLGASGTVIGGDYFTEGNVIAGNTGEGVAISVGASGNSVMGNRIGVNAASAKQPNGGNGVHVEESSNDNVIGGGEGVVDGVPYEYGNVISGNGKNGVLIDHTEFFLGPWHTQVLGNYIGLAPDGKTETPNQLSGIKIVDGPDTWVGDGIPGHGNVISGNELSGVSITDSTGVKVYGNLIGTDAVGLAAKPNKSDGVNIQANGVFVGAAGALFRNIISGNGRHGVYISESNDNKIQNNYIGLGSDGDKMIPNKGNGVTIEGVSSKNFIGGGANLGNVISGNGGLVGAQNNNGIALLAGATETTVSANLVGTDATGKLDRGNTFDGLYIAKMATKNTIGANGAANVFSGNDLYGIEIEGTENTIDFNLIGLDITATMKIENTMGWRKDDTNKNTWGNNNQHQ